MARSKRRRAAAWVGTLPLIAGMMFAASGAAIAAPVLDQSSTDPADLTAVIGSSSIGQTFRAGVTGQLAGVSVDVVGFDPALRLQVQLWSVRPPSHLPQPKGELLGETTLNEISATLRQLITFPTPIPVTAGLEYAVVVRYVGTPFGPGVRPGEWRGTANDRYPDGALFSYRDGQWRFGPPGADAHFQTYVEPAPPGPFCGMTVTSDFQLDRDLGPCPSDGLIVDATTVTVDLQGHTIFGQHAGRGIFVKEFDFTVPNRVTIKNGTVQGFQTGVIGDQSVDVSNMRITENTGTALWNSVGISGFRGCNDIRYSFIDQNGVALTNEGADGPSCFDIHNSYLVSNGGLGSFGRSGIGEILNSYFVDNAFGFSFGSDAGVRRIRNSEFYYNRGSAVIRFFHSHPPNAGMEGGIVGNYFVGNSGAALAMVDPRLDTSPWIIGDNKFWENDYGIDLGESNYDLTIVGNEFASNRIAGIKIDTGKFKGPAQIQLLWNTAARNGFRTGAPVLDSGGVPIRDGIHVRVDAPTTVTMVGNQGRENAGLGIYANNVIDGGSNSGFVNGDPAQCVGVSCFVLPTP